VDSRWFVVFSVCVVGCDPGPRCGTGALDPETDTCVCPLAEDAASTCELPRDRFDTQAHRGARSTFAPGNTLPAFVEAIRLGADTLEGDLQRTLDGAVVLNHDATLSAECVFAGPGVAPASRVVAELTAEEIALFDCHPAIAGLDPPPRLEAVLDLRTRANVGFDLELKDPAPDVVDTIMQAFVDYDSACGHCLEDRLLIQSFDEDALRRARDAFRGMLDFETSFLVLYPGDDPAYVAQFADVYAPTAPTLDAEFIARFHDAGLRVIPWTVNDEAEMCGLIDMGVDGIISDDPALLVRTAERCR